MVVTTDSVLDALKAGTYTLDSMVESRMFKTEQPVKRRKYPSIELLETPKGNTETDDKTNFVRKFDIRIFLGLRGGTTTGQEDEISSLETLEQEVLVVMESTVLEDHKITIEERSFNRHYDNEGLRPYIMSTLTITVRVVTPTTDTTPDGVLVYVIATSVADNKPGADYTYTNVYDVEIDEGYNEIDEKITGSTNPQRFADTYAGTFIANIRVKAADLGSTSEKLDQLWRLQANGEKQDVSFKYTNKAGDSPTTSDIQRDLLLDVDSVKEQYKSNDVTVFRIIAKINEPTTTTVI